MSNSKEKNEDGDSDLSTINDTFYNLKENLKIKKSPISSIIKTDFFKDFNEFYTTNSNFLLNLNNLFDILQFGSDKKKICEFYFEYLMNYSTEKNEENNLNKDNEKKQAFPVNKSYTHFKLLNSTFYIFALNLLFLFMIIYPLCSIIEIYKTNNGFTYVFLVILIAYQCDIGALFFGKLFGKKKFGYPITPTKTYEGIFGAFLLGYIKLS